jgi:hypothetical protein
MSLELLQTWTWPVRFYLQWNTLGPYLLQQPRHPGIHRFVAAFGSMTTLGNTRPLSGLRPPSWTPTPAKIMTRQPWWLKRFWRRSTVILPQLHQKLLSTLTRMPNPRSCRPPSTPPLQRPATPRITGPSSACFRTSISPPWDTP